MPRWLYNESGITNKPWRMQFAILLVVFYPTNYLYTRINVRHRSHHQRQGYNQNLF